MNIIEIFHVIERDFSGRNPANGFVETSVWIMKKVVTNSIFQQFSPIDSQLQKKTIIIKLNVVLKIIIAFSKWTGEGSKLKSFSSFFPFVIGCRGKTIFSQLNRTLLTECFYLFQYWKETSEGYRRNVRINIANREFFRQFLFFLADRFSVAKIEVCFEVECMIEGKCCGKNLIKVIKWVLSEEVVL